MIIIGTQVRTVRRKQADNMLAARAIVQVIGIGPITYKKVVQSGKVKNIVYVRVVNQLIEDY